ncbi:MAG: MalT-like region [Thermoanaerobaculia bacterium]|jgi:tetratricopeptide (TPR) repeat protein|nr:MalT-like region [Thermoanaerobaculia bacterium]
MSHYTEDQLSEYALRRQAISDRKSVEEHLAGCAECRKALDFIENFDAALRDPLPWELADSMTARREAPPELIAQARAIAAEDAHARALVMPLVESPIRFGEANIDDDPRFHTLAVVRLLCTIANQTHEQQPQYGLLLADAAVNICAKLPQPAKSKSAWHTGTAWKERANALRYLGRFKDAEAALDRAEDAFLSDRRPEPFDLAIVSYVRATIRAETEQFADAVRLAREAAEEFLVYGDRRRYLSARMVEGVGYYCVDRDAEALPIFESVVVAARAEGETWILGGALANAASCYTHLHSYEQAAENYEEALAVFTALNVPTESARILWALAAMRVERGDYDEGLEELERARERLTQLDLSNDAALATLDLAGGLMAAGQPDRVPELCRSVAVAFASEGMTRNARKALAFLSEAVSSGSVTPDLVRHVRTYLEKLPIHPNQEFVQLQ